VTFVIVTLVFALEGLICVLLILPSSVVLAVLGAVIGYALRNAR